MPRRGPGHGPMPGEKAKDFKGTMKKLMGYMGKYKIALLLSLIHISNMAMIMQEYMLKTARNMRSSI